MTVPVRTFVGMLVVTVLAAALAGWLGVQYGLHHVGAAPDLDTVLHERLGLRPDQDRKIEKLESIFAAERHSLRAEMHASDRDLATAIAREHALGTDARQAIEHFHRAMLQLQEDTVRHVLSMRAVLDPQQAREFDSIIAKALIGDSRDTR